MSSLQGIVQSSGCRNDISMHGYDMYKGFGKWDQSVIVRSDNIIDSVQEPEVRPLPIVRSSATFQEVRRKKQSLPIMS